MGPLKLQTCQKWCSMWLFNPSDWHKF